MLNQIAKRLSIAMLLLLTTLPFHACVSDKGTEIPAEVEGVLYSSTGAPAANALVSLVPVNFTPGASASDAGIFLAHTRASGRYSFKKVPDGYYNVIASGSGLVAFRDSVLIFDGANLSNDTLRPSGTLTANVQLQPQHSPQTATVQVLGTEFQANVPANGRITLTLPQGSYQLRLSVSLSEYTTLNRTVAVTSGVNDTLADPLVPFYSGIPAVLGLTATADSAGKVILKWKNAGYAALQRYLVYRVPAGSLSQGELIANTTDTSYVDTVFAQGFGQLVETSRQGYFSDTLPRAYDYRVRVMSLTGESGLAFGFAKATARSAAVYQGIPSATGLTAVADSSGRVRLQWQKSHPEYAGSFNVYRSVADSAGEELLIATIKGTSFTDTVFVRSYGVFPKPEQFAFTDTMTRDFEYHVRAQDGPVLEKGPASLPANASAFPPARRPEFNSGRWHKALASTPWTTNILNVLVFKGAIWIFEHESIYSTTLRAWRSTGGTTWQAMDSLPFTSYKGGSFVVHKDTLWAMTSFNKFNGFYGNSLYKSADGINWESVSDSMSIALPFSDVGVLSYLTSEALISFGDSLKIVGGINYSGNQFGWSVRSFTSADGKTWHTIIHSLSVATGHPLDVGMSNASQHLTVFQGSLWIIGGDGSLNESGFPRALNYSVFRNLDGATWNQVANYSTIAFLPRSRHALATHGGKLWAIGGQGTSHSLGEVWSSADGISWVLADIFPPFGSRSDAHAISFNGKLWLIGGRKVTCSPNTLDCSGYSTLDQNDIWYYE